MTLDEAFQQYGEELERIAQQARAARNYARIVLREQLKAIRKLEQKTRRGVNK